MQYSTSTKGMIKDINDLQKGDDIYSFALNATVESFSEEHSFPFLGNTPSNIKCAEFSKGDVVIGKLKIPELGTTIIAIYNKETKRQLLVSVNYTKFTSNLVKSECGIKLVDTKEDIGCFFKELFSTYCLKWDISNPLQFSYKLTDCTINLYWVNAIDEDRFLYFNLDWTINENFKVNNSTDPCKDNFIEVLDCDKTLWYPKISVPLIETEIISDGNKPNGRYSYSIAYSSSSGQPLTNFYGLTNGASLFNIDSEESGKGVKLSIRGITTDSRYEYYTVVSTETVKGITQYRVVGTYPVNQQIIFDTDNEGVTLLFSDLNYPIPYYKSSSLISSSNNILFRGGLEEYPKFNLQPVINEVEVKWVSKVLKEGDYADGIIAVQDASALRDEVYALGIEPILDNGEKLPIYPLVSRQKNSYDAEIITNDDIHSTDNCTVDKKERWEVYNTAGVEYTSSKTHDELYDKCYCDDGIYQKGSFSYWESVEKYPSISEVWGDLCGQPIRHFKFPDHYISPIQNDNTSFSEKNYIFPLGISIESNMEEIFDRAVTRGLITQEQRNRIVGYKLVRSDRRFDKSIVSNGMLFDVWKYQRNYVDENFGDNCEIEKEDYYFPNYPFNDLNPDKFLSSVDNHYNEGNNSNPSKLNFQNTGRFTFHSPDTHFAEPSLGRYIDIRSELTGKSRGFFNQSQEFAKYKLLSWKLYNVAAKIGGWISDLYPNPTEETIKETFTNFGTNIGSTFDSLASTAASSVSGVPINTGGIISSLSGLLGGMIGKKVYRESIFYSFIDEIQKTAVELSEIEKLINIFKHLVDFKHYHYQYQAVGKYNEISPYYKEGEKVFLLEEKAYAREGKHQIGETFLNNKFRESSVYLKVDRPLLPITDINGNLVDNSRVLVSDISSPYEAVTEEVLEEHKCNKFILSVDSDVNITCTILGEVCEPYVVDMSLYPNSRKIKQGSDYIVFRGNAFVEFIARIDIDGQYKVFYEEIGTYRNDNFSDGVIEPREQSFYEKCYRDIKITDYYYNTFSVSGLFKPLVFNKQKNTDSIFVDAQEECASYFEKIIYTEKRDCNCNNTTETNIASYYASIKEPNLNQYGSIYDIKWLNLGEMIRLPSCIRKLCKKASLKKVEAVVEEVREFEEIQVINDITCNTSTIESENISIVSDIECNIITPSPECGTDTLEFRTEAAFESPFSNTTAYYTEQENKPTEITFPFDVTLPTNYPIWGTSLEKNPQRDPFSDIQHERFRYWDFTHKAIKETSTLGTWKEKEVTYFLKPSSYNPDYSKKYYFYNRQFPNFSIPNGKMFINECLFYNDKGNYQSFLDHGSTAVGLEPNAPINKRFKFISDAWLYSLGMPQQYNSTQAEFDAWTSSLDETVLFNSFVSTFQSYKDYNYILWNAEDIISRWTVDRYKIENCFIWWQSQNYNAKISAWGHSPYVVSKYSSITDPPALWFTDFHKNIDVWQMMGYLTSYDEGHYIPRYLKWLDYNNQARLSINKPDIKLLYSIFSNIETVDDYSNTHRVYVTNQNNHTIEIQVKPLLHPAMMQSIGVWTMAIGDGVDLWDFPAFLLNEDSSQFVRGMNLTTNTYYESLLNNEAFDMKEDRKNVDWLAAGIYSVSVGGNKEIIEDISTHWVFVKSYIEVVEDNTVLIAYKISNGKALVLAQAPPNMGESSTRIWDVNINGKTYDIKTYGRFTTVAQIDLNLNC